VSNTERVNFAPGGTIRIDGSYGDLSIEGWDEPALEITVTKSVPYDYKPKPPQEGTKQLAAVQVMAKRVSDSELEISTGKGKDDVMIQYHIRAPRESKLVIHHGNGSVFVSDIDGDIETAASRGDIVLMLSAPGPYSIDAGTKLGTIVSDFAGESRRHHFVGRAFTTGSSEALRHISLRMGYGGITIKSPFAAAAPEP
jgi:hypothetical protein